MKRMNKVGQWQNYLLPAIMAVLVLGLSFYFIFNSAFTGQGADREVCKESIILRGVLPEIDRVGMTLVSFKDEFPIKCRTNVIEVTEDDIEADKDGKRKVDNLIGDALAECWFVFGSGDIDVFEASVYGKTTTCIPCARIHLTDEAKKAVMDDKELNGTIDIKGLLEGAKLDNKFFYMNYLRGAGKLFDPFNPAFSNPFNLSGDKFSVGGTSRASRTKRIRDGTTIEMEGRFSDVSLPRYLNVSQGDLVIVVGELTDSGRDEAANYIPYMFYFQNGQKGYTEEMENQFYDGWTNIADHVCNYWEGIPA